MFSRKLCILAALLSLCGLITPKGQVTSLDPHARLLQVAEDIDENVEDLEDGIDDIGDEIEDMEDEIEDFGEGIEDMETGVEAVAAKVSGLQWEVQTMRNTLESELGVVQKEILQHTESQHKLAQELAMMQGDINSTLYTMQGLKLQLTTLIQELILTPHSCSELDPSSPSGYYLVNWNRVRVYCDMDRQSCGCGSTPGWMRVADIDMTDPNQQCPERFRLRSGTSKRMCEMTKDLQSAGCTSIVFPTHSVRYSRVCGRIKAYQYGSPDAFYPYSSDRSRTIDNMYVEGVSITHGWNPRKHVWTFAAGVDEVPACTICSCPCVRSFAGNVPPYIGNDYFCDTASRQLWQAILYTEDPLWDGKGCGSASSCCQFNSPPWFCKELPQPTTDDIELRVCRNEPRSNEEISFEAIELYVK